jgi:acetyl-CoA synthetase
VGDGRCPIVDTWWQTETGGHMITPLPNAWLQKPGSATLPFFGVVPVLLDEKGHEVKGEGEGYLCIKQAWPATLRTVYGDHERYETNYFKPFPGYYFSGGAAFSPHIVVGVGPSAASSQADVRNSGT